jgi:3D (Asp-Asp-Asp) domain-containing protein
LIQHASQALTAGKDEKVTSMSLDRRHAVSFDLSRLAIVAVAVAVCGCSSESGNNECSMVVSVSAYNSVPSQTNSEPDVTAWGDKLKPGMKAVAVSPDLLDEGLSHGSKVKIEGLEGTYVVLDKTNARFTKRVDVYMGVDVEAAKEFGVQQLRVTWSE